MAKRRAAYIVTAIALVVLMQCWFLARLYWAARWNTWVNLVQVAVQPGSTDKLVERMLGKPNQVYKPDEVLGKFIPAVQTPRPVEKVYVYGGFFFLEGGFWNAYLLFDRAGKVVGSYMNYS